MSAVLETGKLEIKNIERALFHLGNVYEDPRDALAEFVTNGIDAEARHIILRIHRRGATGRIEIEDDGEGMTAADLSRVAHSICDSIKAFDESTVGEKGIGILGYQEVAEECNVISRGESTSTSNTLRLHKGSRNFEIVTTEAGHRRPLQGTTVQLLGIDKQRMRQFTLAKIEEHLKKKFRVHLADGNIHITLVEGREARRVQPDSYKGVPFYIDSLRTHYGDIRLALHIVPGGRTESVAVYHKGNLVLQRLADLDEFQHEPWTLGKVAGEITNDFNKLTTGRTGFIRHSRKWPVWVNSITGIEKQLQAEIDRLTKEASDEATRQMHKRIREAFLKALSELPSFGGISAPVASSQGDPQPGTPSKEERLIVLPEKDRATRPENRNEGRPPLDPSKSPTPARSGAGFNLMEAPIHESPDLHSDFNDRTVLIRVNTIHPDYTRESESQERKESYIVRLIAKEMTLHEYPDTNPANLLEKLLDLELAARRHLMTAVKKRTVQPE